MNTCKRCLCEKMGVWGFPCHCRTHWLRYSHSLHSLPCISRLSLITLEWLVFCPLLWLVHPLQPHSESQEVHAVDKWPYCKCQKVWNQLLAFTFTLICFDFSVSFMWIEERENGYFKSLHSYRSLSLRLPRKHKLVYSMIHKSIQLPHTIQL